MQKTTPCGTGLRARQRQESLRQIHVAARDLVNERGFAATTIAEIAERAGVSRRTLFNYYASKEDAMLGLAPARIPEYARQEFFENADGDNLLGCTVMLLARTLQHTRQGGITQDETRELLLRYPELHQRVQQRFHEMEELITEFVLEHLNRADEAWSGDVQHVEALMMLAGAVVKLGFRHNPNIFAEPNRASFEPAIVAFREALKETK